MPGLELFNYDRVNIANNYSNGQRSDGTNTPDEVHSPSPDSPLTPSLSSDVYYNPRLDPKNFLEGPLSLNPATRLRQMLARPGIVVSLMTLIQNFSISANLSTHGQVAPGVCDGISARVCLEAGFDCMYQR